MSSSPRMVSWKIEFIARREAFDCLLARGGPIRGRNYSPRSSRAPSALCQSALWPALLRQFAHAPPSLVFDGRLRPIAAK